MNILVYGAGVLGSLYAARLQQAGHQVTILARGTRLAEIREHGIVLEEAESGQREIVPTHVTGRLDPTETFDLALVVVRKNQLVSVLPDLSRASGIPAVLFLVNNAAGPRELVEVLGRERVLLGFPGAGGQRQDGVVRYRLAGEIQPTTIGELDGEITPRLQAIAVTLERAGLPVKISTNIDSWLKTHVALVSPIANAIYLAGGSNYRLARTRDGLVRMVRAVREGLRVLQALGISITPAAYRALLWLPEPLLVAVLQRRMNAPSVELVVTRHANAARDEMGQLAEEFRRLAERSGLPTPNLDYLRSFVDPAQPALPEGEARLPLDWRWAWKLGASLSGAALGIWLVKRLKN